MFPFNTNMICRWFFENKAVIHITRQLFAYSETKISSNLAK